MTIVELLIVLAIVGTIASILIPNLLQALESTKIKRAINDIATISFNANSFQRENDRYPDDMTEFPIGPTVDPWGNEYVYRPSTAADWNAKRRRDRWMNPLNSDFDVYSVGRDGDSKAPLAPPVSHDDIVRANSGSYIGPAWQF